VNFKKTCILFFPSVFSLFIGNSLGAAHSKLNSDRYSISSYSEFGEESKSDKTSMPTIVSNPNKKDITQQISQPLDIPVDSIEDDSLTLDEIRARERGVIVPYEPTSNLYRAASQQAFRLRLGLNSSVSYLSDITGLEDRFASPEISSSSDIVFSNYATLTGELDLGSSTMLLTSVRGGAIRYGEQGTLNYNLLDISAGFRQQISRQMYADLSWAQSHVFSIEDGERSLLDNSIKFALGREDLIAPDLFLQTNYSLRTRFADPADQSFIANRFGVGLFYFFDPSLYSYLNYRLTLRDYTQEVRFDFVNNLTLGLTYQINSEISWDLLGSYQFGTSSDEAIDLESLSITTGIRINALFD